MLLSLGVTVWGCYCVRMLSCEIVLLPCEDVNVWGCYCVRLLLRDGIICVMVLYVRVLLYDIIIMWWSCYLLLCDCVTNVLLFDDVTVWVCYYMRMLLCKPQLLYVTVWWCYCEMLIGTVVLIIIITKLLLRHRPRKESSSVAHLVEGLGKVHQ